MDAIVLSGILGAFVPTVVSFVKNNNWPRIAKFGLAVVVSTIIGFFSLFQDGQLTDLSWKSVVTNIAVVFSASQIVYQTYFGDSNLNAVLENKKVF